MLCCVRLRYYTSRGKQREQIVAQGLLFVIGGEIEGRGGRNK